MLSFATVVELTAITKSWKSIKIVLKLVGEVTLGVEKSLR